jgi:hypothetical protein
MGGACVPLQHKEWLGGWHSFVTTGRNTENKQSCSGCELLQEASTTR